MKTLNIQNQDENLEVKRFKAHKGAVVNMCLAGALTAGALCSALIGAAEGIGGEMVFDDVVKDCIKTQEFQDSLAGRRQQLIEDLSEGKISYEEFKKLYEGLESTTEVMAYSDNNLENEELAESVSRYREATQVANIMTQDISGRMLCGAVVSAGLMLGFDALRQNYDKKIAKRKASVQQEESVQEEVQEEMGE